MLNACIEPRGCACRSSKYNRGMNPPENTLFPKTLSHGALRHQVVRRLLNSIFLGESPSGAQLRVMKLAAQYGLSSTPIREALVELESVGMISFVHNRGAIVNAFGPGQLREIYQLRRILEVEATCSACGRIDAGELESLRREMKLLLKAKHNLHWAEREMATDRRLHALIAASCGSKRLAQEIHRYDTLIQSLRDVVGHERRAQQLANREHIAILDALLADDAPTAVAAMAGHIDHTADSVSKVLFSRKSR